MGYGATPTVLSGALRAKLTASLTTTSTATAGAVTVITLEGLEERPALEAAGLAASQRGVTVPDASPSRQCVSAPGPGAIPARGETGACIEAVPILQASKPCGACAGTACAYTRSNACATVRCSTRVPGVAGETSSTRGAQQAGSE